MSLCSECQSKVEALERAIRCTIRGSTKDVEWNQCGFTLGNARRLIWAYKDYCRRKHGAEVKMAVSCQLSIDELQDVVIAWVREKHGIDMGPESVSFVCEDSKLLHVAIEYSHQES